MEVHFIKISLLKDTSLCPGIVKAIKTINQVNQNDAYLFAPIAHNNLIQQAIKEKGIIDVNKNFDQIPENATIIFGAHGIKQEDYQLALKKNLKIIDTTCPIVNEIAKIIIEYVNNDYYIFIIGKKQHQEAMALASYDYQKIKILESVNDIKDTLNFIGKKIMITTQTTISQKEIDQLLPQILNKYPDAHFIDKRCHITKNNQNLLSQIDPTIEAIIVISDKQSNNGNKLYQLAKEKFDSEAIFYISNLSQLDVKKIKKFNHIAIISSTSTPDAIIKKLHDALLSNETQELVDVKLSLQDIVDYHK